MAPELPQGFGRYRLLTHLGSGGMADVFRAESEPIAGISRLVAIKRIRRTAWASEPELEQMLLDEARIWVRLRHPNVVSVVDFGEADGDWFLALELVEGVSASTLLERTGPLSPPEAVCVAERVARALAHAHALRDESGASLDIVHRDVKPANILVSTEGQVKLTDFGIARAANRLSRTQAGVVKASIHYASPEQIRGEEIDARSDLFALGIVLHTLVAGRSLFRGTSEQVMRELARGRIPPVTGAFPARLGALVTALLSPRREDRPASALEVARELRALHDGALEDVEPHLSARVSAALGVPATTRPVPLPATVRLPASVAPSPGLATAPATEHRSASPRIRSTTAATPSGSSAQTRQASEPVYPDSPPDAAEAPRREASRSVLGVVALFAVMAGVLASRSLWREPPTPIAEKLPTVDDTTELLSATPPGTPPVGEETPGPAETNPSRAVARATPRPRDARFDWLSRVSDARGAGNLEAAARDAERLTSAYPDYAAGWRLLAQLREDLSRTRDACDAWKRVAALEPLGDDESSALARCDAPRVAEHAHPVETTRPGAEVEDRRDLLAPLVRNKPPARARLEVYEAAQKSRDPALVFEAWRFLSAPPPLFVGAKERELSFAGARTIGSRFLDLSPASDPRRAVVQDWMKDGDAAR